MNTLRYGVTGVLAAVGTQMIADKASSSVLGMINASPGGSSIGNDGIALFRTVVGLSFAAGGVLAGEYILNQLNTGIDDPIYRWFFYQSSFYVSTAARSAVGNIKSLFTRLFRFMDKKSPNQPADPKMGPIGSGPVISQGPSNPKMGPIGSGPVISQGPSNPKMGPIGSGPVISQGPVSTGPYISQGPNNMGTGPVMHNVGYGDGPYISSGPSSSKSKFSNMVNIGSIGDQVIPDSVSHGASSGCGSCASN